MSDNDFHDLFCAGSQLRERCNEKVYEFYTAQMTPQEYTANCNYVQTILTRYGKGNFDNTPTQNQGMNGDMETFLKLDKMVRREIKKAAVMLRKKADNTEEVMQARVERLRAQADQFDEYLQVHTDL